MIVELRKNCQQTIQRTIYNLNQLRNQCGAIPKSVKQKFNIILNDVELLKDNFCLIGDKIIRLELKHSENQFMSQKKQHDFETKLNEYMKANQKLQIKNQKLEKQLNFIKYMNKNLRKDIQILQNKKQNHEKLQSIIRHNLKIDQIPKIQQQFDLKFTCPVTEKCAEDKIQSIGFVSTERTPIKSQLVLAQGQKINRVSQFSSDSDHIKAKKRSQLSKHGYQAKTIVVIPDKKRMQLARLIQEQNKYAKVVQICAASNIF